MTSWLQKGHSDDSEPSETSEQSESSRSGGGASGGCGAESRGLQRSATDTRINYNTSDDVEEVPGSVFYITAKGHLSHQVEFTRELLSKPLSLSIEHIGFWCYLSIDCHQFSSLLVFPWLYCGNLIMCADYTAWNNWLVCVAGDSAGSSRGGAQGVLGAHVHCASQHPQLSHRFERHRQKRPTQTCE